MPGPCSNPLNGTMGKSRFVRLNKNRGEKPAHDYPPNLKARIEKFPGGQGYIKPGSYKK